jgi:hypothetical protein
VEIQWCPADDSGRLSQVHSGENETSWPLDKPFALIQTNLPALKLFQEPP